jgi:plasmid maintenance system killer protein
MGKSILFLFSLMLLQACEPKQKNLSEQNPAAEGFDLANSDPAGIQLADSIMAAMGGRENWDKARFISWNFFGRRDLVWDKQTGRVRIESPADSSVYLVNINTGKGRVKFRGVELTEADTLKKMLNRAKSIWINDSYWLTMPFKLKDSGVTLKYLGEDTLKNDRYNILQLTFANVGVTPENKYKLYVGIKDKMIKHWAFFNDAKKDTANFIRPWDNYQKYGNVMLSADRSDNGGPKNVRVSETLPDKLFAEF